RSHHRSSSRLVRARTMSKTPLIARSQPTSEAIATNVFTGWARATTPPTIKRMPKISHTQRQPPSTEKASTSSSMPVTRKTTPARMPTAVADLASKRKNTSEIRIQRIPVSSGTHHQRRASSTISYAGAAPAVLMSAPPPSPRVLAQPPPPVAVVVRAPAARRLGLLVPRPDERGEAEGADRHHAEPAVEPLRAALGDEHLVVEAIDRVALEDRLHEGAADALALAVRVD